jgi:mannosyltransferase OCH1-like enzyme
MQGADVMPEKYRICVESWKRHHPDWEIMMWSRENIPPMVNSWILDRTDDPTFLSEIVRFEVVLAFGGVYIDADMECWKPIDPIIKHLQAFVTKRNSDYLENAGFGCTRDHPWIRAVVNEINELKGRIYRILDVMGPMEKVTSGRDDVRVFPVHMFHLSEEEVASHSSPDITYSVHHRHGVWNGKY